MGSHFFRAFETKKIICPKVTKMGFIIGHKINQNDRLQYPKETKMGSFIGHKIDQK